MDIGKIKNVIQNYLRGKASPEVQKRLNKWLDKIEQEALNIPDTGAHNHIKEQILQKLRQHSYSTKTYYRKESNTFYPKNSRLRLVAASLTILIIFSFTAYHYQAKIIEVIDPIKMITVSASDWEVRKVVLPDSSVVALNTLGVITYPERFRGDKRKVILEGEAYFEVKKNPLRPFIVEAGQVKVKVLGTSFIVSNSSLRTDARVTVCTGKVAVASESNETSILLPHDLLIYDKQSQSQQIDHNVEINTQWTKNLFVFKSASLFEVFNALEDHFGVTIQFSEAAFRNLTFTGIFGQEDTLPEILRIIETSYRLNIQVVNHQLIKINIEDEQQ